MKFVLLWLGLVVVLLAVPACALLSAATTTPTPTNTLLPTVSSTPEPIGTPPPTVAPTTVLAPPPTAAAQPTPVRLSFAPGGTTATAQGTVAVNALDRYVLRASAGQTLEVKATATQGSVALGISGADGTVLLSERAGPTSFSGKLTATQDYTIGVRGAGTGPATYTLEITISPLATIVRPTPIAEPTLARQRITFPPGGTSATIQGKTATSGFDRFVIRAQAGQTMTVKVTSASNNVILIIFGADGNVLISDHAGAMTWTGVLPSTQDYNIDTRSVADSVVPFTLSVTIPPK